MKYINADKLKAEIERQQRRLVLLSNTEQVDMRRDCALQNGVYDNILDIINSLQQEQPEHMIQWTGHNLKEVIDFTGKSPRFDEWFKSWKEFESYVHSHGDILKLFSDDGSHYEVPVGAWIIKTPDGYNVPLVTRLIHAKQEQPEVDLEKEIQDWCKENVTGVNPIYTADSLIYSLLPKTARHFYELGQSYRYQIDREEFAKLKAKEWQEGYNEGYAKGLNARKEE